MIKQSIRLVGCIIALFALILVFKHSHLMQEEKPLNTTERFNIAVLSTTISKERLVNELNALVDQYGAVLVKVVPNQDNYKIIMIVRKISYGLVLSSLTEPVPESGITAFRGWSLLSAVN